MTMVDFFEFAYLDEMKISKFLTQKNRGMEKRRVIRETASTTHDAQGGITIPLVGEVGGGLEKSSKSQNEIEIESNAEGEFTRFHEFLCSQPDFVQGTQTSISFEHLPRRGFCEIEGIIQVSLVHQNIARLFQIGSLHSEFIGGTAEVSETIRRMGHIFQTDKIPVTINDDEGKPVVLTVLDKGSLSIPLEEIEEEYLLLGKIIRIIKPNDPPYDILKDMYNPCFSQVLSPQMLRQMLMTMPVLSGMSNKEPPTQLTLKLEGPLVILSPIAIYR
jgi:hypothetical protein